jgi:hypothetical protein
MTSKEPSSIREGEVEGLPGTRETPRAARSRRAVPKAERIAPDPNLAALVSYACEQVAQRLAGQRRYADWLAWAARWQGGERSPSDCVAVGQECFARKDMVFPTLGQLCWAGKEACYSAPTSPWLVIRYVADAMLAFGVHYPERLLPALAYAGASPSAPKPEPPK